MCLRRRSIKLCFSVGGGITNSQDFKHCNCCHWKWSLDYNGKIIVVYILHVKGGALRWRFEVAFGAIGLCRSVSPWQPEFKLLCRDASDGIWSASICIIDNDDKIWRKGMQVRDGKVWCVSFTETFTFHHHADSCPVKSKKDKKTQEHKACFPPRGLETRMSHLPWGGCFYRLVAFDLLCLETCKSACPKIEKIWEGKQRGLILRVMQLDSWSLVREKELLLPHGHKELWERNFISQKGVKCSMVRVRYFILGE